MKDTLLKLAAAAIALVLFSAPAPLMAGADIETEEVDEDLRPDEPDDDGAEDDGDGY